MRQEKFKMERQGLIEIGDTLTMTPMWNRPSLPQQTERASRPVLISVRSRLWRNM